MDYSKNKKQRRALGAGAQKIARSREVGVDAHPRSHSKWEVGNRAHEKRGDEGRGGRCADHRQLVVELQ